MQIYSQISTYLTVDPWISRVKFFTPLAPQLILELVYYLLILPNVVGWWWGGSILLIQSKLLLNAVAWTHWFFLIIFRPCTIHLGKLIKAFLCIKKKHNLQLGRNTFWICTCNRIAYQISIIGMCVCEMSENQISIKKNKNDPQEQFWVRYGTHPRNYHDDSPKTLLQSF
jgi:hypothetical protein